VPGLVLLVQVLQGLGPVLLGLEPLGLVPVQVQALVALLGPEPVLAVLLVQVVPAQGGLRVVVVLAACLFYLLVYFPQRRICCNNCLNSSLEYERCCEYNSSIRRGSFTMDWISPGVFLAISSLVRSLNWRTLAIMASLTRCKY
tara:strand:+ start:107 stop:538 length:432 start_codon:yes stop_codon:yes gene_type:complete